MGGYFCLIAIAKPPPSALLEALALLEHSKGDFVEVFRSSSGHCLIMPGQSLHDAKGIAYQLSTQLSTSCFLFNYSDDVVWSYELFYQGSLVDSYTSRPNYFAEASKEGLSRTKGNAVLVSSHWPEVSADAISGYLTNKEVADSSKSKSKAYPDDKHDSWDVWQLCDFMRKVGVEYPVDEDGELVQKPFSSASIATPAGLAEKAAFEEQSAKLKSMFQPH